MKNALFIIVSYNTTYNNCFNLLFLALFEESVKKVVLKTHLFAQLHLSDALVALLFLRTHITFITFLKLQLSRPFMWPPWERMAVHMPFLR